MSLAGWAVGIQLQPDSPIILVHCQDLKKIPRASGLVSWIDAARPVVCRRLLCWAPVRWAALLGGLFFYICCAPGGGDLTVRGASEKSAQLLPGSLSYHPEGSVMDASSGSPGSAVTFLPQEVLLVDATISLHPFFMHQLDVGPSKIVHAFNYRVAVLRDGVKSAARRLLLNW